MVKSTSSLPHRSGVPDLQGDGTIICMYICTKCVRSTVSKYQYCSSSNGAKQEQFETVISDVIAQTAVLLHHFTGPVSVL